MTVGMWECKKCEHVIPFINISTFISECPECGVRYIKLATLWGFHIAHSIPYYIMEGEDFKEATINIGYCMAMGNQGRTFICHDEEFYNWVKDKAGEDVKVYLNQDEMSYYTYLANEEKDKEVNEILKEIRDEE